MKKSDLIRRLEAIGIACGAASLFKICHPDWDYPFGSGILISTLFIFAIATWFDQKWRFRLALFGALAGMIGCIVDQSANNKDALMCFPLVGMVFCGAGILSRNLWPNRDWQFDPEDVDVGELEEGDEAESSADHQKRMRSIEKHYSQNGNKNQHRSWTSTRRRLINLLWRNRTSILFGLSSLSFGLYFVEAGRQAGFDFPTMAFGIPNVILAIGFWLRHNWIRWFGALLCLLWALLALLMFILPDPLELGVFHILFFTLLTVAWKLWNWKWDR